VKLLADKKELGRKMAELEVVEAGLRRSVTELGEQLEFERDKRECLEKELLDAVEEREQLRQQLENSQSQLASLAERDVGPDVADRRPGAE